jgi:hypothetical protein
MSSNATASDLHLYFLLETGKTEAGQDEGTFCGYSSLRNLIPSYTPPASAPALIHKIVHCDRQRTQFFDGIGTRTSSNFLQRCFYFPIRLWLRATGYEMSEFQAVLRPSGPTIILQKIRFSMYGRLQKVAKMGIA